VAYDEVLADRAREVLAAEADVTEKKMFGGLAFLVGGHMVVFASRGGGLLFKAPPADHERLVRAGAVPMEMGGRTMQGWLRVDADGLRTRRQLTRWTERSLALARALPARARKR
jgi:TfoX/Sxy family transcriptional regulator of competence genes